MERAPQFLTIINAYHTSGDMSAEALNEQSVIDYVRGMEMAPAILGEVTSLSATAITEGNINLIFRVMNVAGNRSVLVKQALPYSWRAHG